MRSSQHMKQFHNSSISKKQMRIICPYESWEENVFTSLKLRQHSSETQHYYGARKDPNLR